MDSNFRLPVQILNADCKRASQSFNRCFDAEGIEHIYLKKYAHCCADILEICLT